MRLFRVASLRSSSGFSDLRYREILPAEGVSKDGAKALEDRFDQHFDPGRISSRIPVLPVTLSASIEGGNIQISFPTQDGVSYQMAYKSSLTNVSWTPIEIIVGDGSTGSVFLGRTGSMRKPR